MNDEYEPKIIEINIDDIKEKIKNNELQNRKELCSATVEHYVENIEEILDKHPIEVCRLGSELYLVNGYHRMAAYRQAKPDATTIRAGVSLVEGVNAVIIKAAKANFGNGLQLKSTDRRTSVMKLSTTLDYKGISESGYVDQLVEITKLPRKTIQRYTEEQRLEIRGRFAVTAGSYPQLLDDKGQKIGGIQTGWVHF